MGLSWEVSLGRWDPLGRVLDLGHSQAGFCLPCAQLLQSCPTLCDHRTFSPPDSSVHGISQARILVHAKSLQSCPTLCDPMDCSPPDFSVHGILQARILVGCHPLLQGIFLTQGSNPHLFCLLHWQAGSLPLAPPGKLLGKILSV